MKKKLKHVITLNKLSSLCKLIFMMEKYNLEAERQSQQGTQSLWNSGNVPHSTCVTFQVSTHSAKATNARPQEMGPGSSVGGKYKSTGSDAERETST